MDASFLMVVFLLTKLNFSLHHVIFWALKPAMRIWSPKSSPRGTFAHHQCRRLPPPPPPPPPPPTPAKHPPPPRFVLFSCLALVSHTVAVWSYACLPTTFKWTSGIIIFCFLTALSSFLGGLLPSPPPPHPPRARARPRLVLNRSCIC